MSVRLTLTLSYAGFLVVAGALLLAAVWAFLLRYVPDGPIDASLGFIPNRSDLLEAFAPAATAVLLFLLALGLGGGWFLAGRILAPLAQIDSAARSAGRGVLSERIRMAGKGNEFSDTADVFDAMLDQLETHVEEQQRFAANASHELRTPLAITQTLLDVAQKDPNRDVDALLERLRSVNSRAIELADALLLLTRSRQLPVDLDRVDLSLLAEEAAENLLPLAERRGITLAIEGDAAPVVGSEPLLLQLTTNLLHNAIVHNVTSGGSVAVRTGVRSGAAVLTVENPGPELDPETAATLVEPFQRGEGRTRADDHAGTGLGLAIVQNIVHAHRGVLTIAPRHGGGAIVTVRLPVGG